MKNLFYGSLLILAIGIAILLLIGKKHIRTEIIINASIDKTWLVLTDFSKYPAWNPFITKINGKIIKGKKIDITFHTQGEGDMIFSPRLTEYDENRLLKWEGDLFIPGIFTAEHSFNLNKVETYKTKVIQEEHFKGILVPFFNYDSTKKGFTLMNEALKKKVESI